MHQRILNQLAWGLASVRPAEGDSDTAWYTWNDCMNQVKRVAAENNPRFKREKFVDACLTWGGEVLDGAEFYGTPEARAKEIARRERRAAQ